MPFFTCASGISITDGSFSEIGGDFIINITTQEPKLADHVIQTVLGKRRERESGESHLGEPVTAKKPRITQTKDGLMIVRRDEIKLLGQLVNRSNYQIHSASHGGRAVVVKVFQGTQAIQDCAATVALSRKLFHSNIPNIIGVSHEGVNNPFVVFDGPTGKKMQSLIAKALRTDLNHSIHLSLKAVKGLAAGLGYLSSQNISFGGRTLVNTKKWENFDILIGENDEPIIAFQPVNDRSLSSGLSITGNDDGINALDGLCHKLFSEANSILYDDAPERESVTYHTEQPGTISWPQNKLRHSLSASEADTEVESSSSMKLQNSTQPPRREVWWRRRLDDSNRSLNSIAQGFEDYLDCRFMSSSSLRRIERLNMYPVWMALHQCPGYLREEITLTSDVSKSAIITHPTPSPNERCSVCGELVQYPDENQVEELKNDVVVDDDPAYTEITDQPPQWLSAALRRSQARYPNDQFEVVLRKRDLPEWRIKCLDCPSKLYFPGPGETLSNYDVHLRNPAHRERVIERLVAAVSSPPVHGSSPLFTTLRDSLSTEPKARRNNDGSVHQQGVVSVLSIERYDPNASNVIPPDAGKINFEILEQEEYELQKKIQEGYQALKRLKESRLKNP